MATRDGETQDSVAPKDRRLPLAVVVFKEPTLIPGCDMPFTNVTVGEQRNMGGYQFACPQAFLDPVMRSIVIEGREYPLERVHYWQRARMARKVAEVVLPEYKIGRRI